MTYAQKSLKSGFSMIELMISLAIIILILSFVGPSLTKLMSRGDKAATKNTLKVLEQAIMDYKMDVGKWPNRLEDLDKRPEDVTGWDGSYLPAKMQGKDIVDGWGQDIVYKLNPPGTTPRYRLYSEGDPDKEENYIEA